MRTNSRGRFKESNVVGIFILILVAAGWVHAETYGVLTYEIHGDAIEITGCNKTEVGSLLIPAEIEGKPVVVLGGFPHDYSKALTRFLVPGTVTNINDRTFFYCNNLESIDVATDNPSYASMDGVLFNKELTKLIRCPAGKSGIYTVPESVVSISDRAFSMCAGLTNIVLPNSLESIGGSAFFRCELEQIDLPKSLVSIGNRAFWECNALIGILFPENVTSIGNNALSTCVSLENIEVAEGNKNYASIDGVLFNKELTRLMQYPREKSGAYAVPETVTTIDHEAFCICKGLTNVVFPKGLESIGANAFELCDGLKRIHIPAGVENIDATAFKRCRGLESFVVEEGNQHYASVDGVLFNKDLTTLIQCPAKKSDAYMVPEGVEEIASSAFSYCRDLTGILLPVSLVSIRNLAFSECDGLSEITLPDAVESIGFSAFSNCDGLTNIVIPASLQNIDSWRTGANVVVKGESQQYTSMNGALFSKDLTKLIRCPVEKSGMYTVPGSVTSIVEFAFRSCCSLTNIVLPESLESIGRFSFRGCTGLESIVVPASVRSIGRGAFAHCKGMEFITVESANLYYATVDGVLLNKDLTELIQYPLGRAGSYSVPGSTTTIKELAFAGSSLTRIDLSESTTFIERTAFSMCRDLLEMFFPEGVAFIDEYAFGNCSSLSYVAFMGNAPVLAKSVFYKTDPGFIVHYFRKNNGFSSPEWNGYPAQPIHPAILWLRMNRKYSVLIILLLVATTASLCHYAVRMLIRRKKET